MTQRNRWTVSSLSMVTGVLAFVLALGMFRDYGRAEARNAFVAQADAPDAMPRLDIPPPPPGSLGDQPALAGSGSESVPRATLPSAGNETPAVVEPARTDVDPSLALTLWRSGAFTSAGIVIVYLLLTLWRKVDKKHAFYTSALLGGIDMLINCIVVGSTPTAAMMMAATSTTLAILARGPAKEPEPS